MLRATVFCLFLIPLHLAAGKKVDPPDTVGPQLEGYHHKIHSSQYSDEEKRLLKKLWILTSGNGSFGENIIRTPEAKQFFDDYTPHMTAEAYRAYEDTNLEERRAKFKQEKRKNAVNRIEFSRKRIAKAEINYEEIEEAVIAKNTGIYSEAEMESSLKNYQDQRDSEIYGLQDLIRTAERVLAEMEAGGDRGKSLDGLDEEDKALRRKQMERAALAKQNAINDAVEQKRRNLEIGKKKYEAIRNSEVRRQNELTLLDILAYVNQQDAIAKEQAKKTLKKLEAIQKRLEKSAKRAEAGRIKRILSRESAQKQALKKYKAKRGY